MSVQILLQGRISGLDEFLLAPGVDAEPEADSPNRALTLAGRAWWGSLLSEVLPRAILAELGLSRILLGSSSRGQFLLVLPGEARERAEEILAAAAAEAALLSAERVALTWGVTENLGDWTDVRRRIEEDLAAHERLPAATGENLFTPFAPPRADDAYFFELGQALVTAASVSWSPEHPARVETGVGQHTWPVATGSDDGAIPFTRRLAIREDGTLAPLEELATRAAGFAGWGLLRGDVDNFATRLVRAPSIEDYLQLSISFRRFFAGELELQCSLPAYWRKVTVLYTGGDDFAVWGAWDALLALAREMQRVFHRFASENLKDLPGPEGKTISMAIAIAPRLDTPLEQVYGDAGRRLGIAKSESKDTIHVMGSTLEWKQLSDAAEFQESLIGMSREYASAGRFFFDLGRAYRIGASIGGGPLERPWRFHWRVHQAFGGLKEKDFTRLRAHLIQERALRGAAQVRLRPSGQVALAWARLATEE